MTKYRTILADPPWRFQNRTGKVAPEHARLTRYDTMTVEDIASLPVPDLADEGAHLYLWVPNALLAEGMEVMRAWGFTYKTNLVWFKTRKDGGPDGRGVGFYFRNVTELVLFGVRGSRRTLAPGRRQVNLFTERKREHSRKPEALYDIIESCSPGPYLELFARHHREGWHQWGKETPGSAVLPAPGWQCAVCGRAAVDTIEGHECSDPACGEANLFIMVDLPADEMVERAARAPWAANCQLWKGEHRAFPYDRLAGVTLKDLRVLARAVLETRPVTSPVSSLEHCPATQKEERHG